MQAAGIKGTDMEGEKTERRTEIDLLRIAACFSVIMLHCSAQHWYDLSVWDSEWIICNTYDAVFRFGVPVFVMISGALFLNREGEIDLRRLYRKNIFRLVTAYWFWSFLYGLWDCRIWFGNEGVIWKDYVMEFLLGRGHLWFIPMLVGIYVILPVLKGWTDHAPRRQIEYFLGLFLVLQIGVCTLEILEIPTMAKIILGFINVPLVCSYVGYFILGYYMKKYPLSARCQKWLYVLGGMGILGAIAVSTLVSVHRGTANAAAYDSFSLFTLLVSAALFLLFQERVSMKKWGNISQKLIRELSMNSFGVYLAHFGIMEALQTVGIDSMGVFQRHMSHIWGIPLLAVLCFVISNFIAAVCRRIPLVGKYIC